MTARRTISPVASAALLPRRAGWPGPSLAIGVALAVGIGAVAFTPAWLALPFAAALMVAGGLPHGASDLAVAAPAWKERFGRAGPALFVATYLALAALVFAVWSAWPLPALLGFLAVSAWHFAGEDTRGESAWERAARGLMPVGLPALLHPAALTDLLRPLLAGSVADARLVCAAMGAAGVAATGALAGWWWHGRGEVARALPSAAALLLCPPLPGFALFFALDHSSHASARRRRALGLSRGAYARACAPAALGGAAVLAAAAWWWPDAGPTGWLIVGLAALTVPHMALVGERHDLTN